MDYRARNPIAAIWTFDAFTSVRTPEPHDVPTGANMYEIDSPDLSTVMLLEHGIISAEGESLILYGIEAPRECLMRQAFEWGKIPWLDYWSHKGWLLRIKVPFNPAPVSSSYITPAQLDSYTRYRMEGLEGRFPYDLKQEQLKLRCLDTCPFFPTKREKAKVEREYQQFMAKYGHRFSQDAA